MQKHKYQAKVKWEAQKNVVKVWTEKSPFFFFWTMMLCDFLKTAHLPNLDSTVQDMVKHKSAPPVPCPWAEAML